MISGRHYFAIAVLSIPTVIGAFGIGYVVGPYIRMEPVIAGLAAFAIWFFVIQGWAIKEKERRYVLQNTEEEIKFLFNELYQRLTSAHARAELGDMSESARLVAEAEHKFEKDCNLAIKAD